MTAEDKKRSKAKSAQPDTAKTAAAAATPEEARTRLAATGRNDACACGSGKKYKKCHLPADEQAAAPPVAAPDAQELLSNGWRLFEQRRPGAAEKEFRAALAVDANLTDAHVGIGMARLSAGNADGAKEELGAVLASGEAKAEELRAKGTKDAFSQPEVQPYIRAAHALGCLAYDEERYEDAAKDLGRVFGIDDGTVGIEARLIAAKALMKLERAADAAALLEPATKLETGKGRAELGLALAKFSAGAEAEAGTALNAALDTNAHYGKALLGRVRRRVENVAAAQPGSLEEALLYTQTYGDVWTEGAKAFLEKILDERAAAKKPAPESADAGAAPPA
jgi:tetratricopeptide (TPR) repeat protein